MNTTVVSSEHQSSRRLPPLEAWKKPDKWMDMTTRLARHNAPSLHLDTDERGFVIPTNAIEQVRELLFWDDYDWPFDHNDPETRPDDHHFHYDEYDYMPINNDGNTIPQRFRETPTMIGRMPRQLHNAIHDFTSTPAMPELEAMSEYVDAYSVAHQAFKRLYRTAKNTVEARRVFTLRRRAIQEGLISPRGGVDLIGEGFMRSDFEKSFESYSEAIDTFLNTSHKDLVSEDYERLVIHKPDHVVKTLGRIVNMQYINYTPLLNNMAA